MAQIERERSYNTWKEMQKRAPGGVHSPVRSCASVGTHPIIVESAHGSHILDIDGNSYIDYCMSWGSLLHGHAHQEIVESAYQAMLLGTSYGITSLKEAHLASAICEAMPSVEMVRFVSSGTEATMSAARLARGYTKRSNILKFSGNYHGHADQFLIQAGSGVFSLPKASSSGIPSAFLQHTHILPYNDLEALHQFLFVENGGKGLAAVIIEPIAANMGVVPMLDSFLELLEKGRREFGFLLIFDEVVTGFRVGFGGAQERYSCAPDLTCLGKIIGGGFPAAAFGGRREIMSCLAPIGDVYQAGTLSGNPVAMAAGSATLELIQKQPNFYQELLRRSELFIKPIQEYIEESGFNAVLQSIGGMWTLFFGSKEVATSHDLMKLDSHMFQNYFLFMLGQGIYIPPLHNEAWFLSTAHSEDEIRATCDATLSFLEDRKDYTR